MKPVRRVRGSLAVEVVLIVPALMMIVMFVVFVGRVQAASIAVRHATDVGARSGSLTHAANAEQRAHLSTKEELSRTQHLCASTRVNATTQIINGEFMVVASAQCVVRMNGLTFLGLSGPTVRGLSSEVIDHFRSS